MGRPQSFASASNVSTTFVLAGGRPSSVTLSHWPLLQLGEFHCFTDEETGDVVRAWQAGDPAQAAPRAANAVG